MASGCCTEVPHSPAPLPSPTANAEELRRMLDCIELEVLPKTELGVQAGNKVFGAAVLKDTDGLPTIIADTNNEMECPLFHGEVHTMKKLSERPAEERPDPASCVFLSTHEPCCMCISAIVWAGYKKVFYLFGYESTKDQGIPHDLDIMYELWRVPKYQQQNKFCATASICEQIASQPEEVKTELQAQVARITEKYNSLANKYHTEKTSNANNKLAFG